MVLYIIDKSNQEDKENGIYNAMTDWLIMVIQAGYKKIEWSPDKTELNRTKDVHKNIDGSDTVSTINNFQFKGNNSNYLHVVNKRYRQVFIELN